MLILATGHPERPIVVVLAFVLALVGIGVTVRPLMNRRLQTYVAASAYIGAAELLLWTFVPSRMLWWSAPALLLLGIAVTAAAIRRVPATEAAPTETPTRHVGLENRETGRAFMHDEKYGSGLTHDIVNEGELHSWRGEHGEAEDDE